MTTEKLDEKGLEAARDRIRRHPSFMCPESAVGRVSAELAEAAIRAYLSHPRAAAPSGWKMVPTEATAENGMKAALIGEFSIEREVYIDDEGNSRGMEFTLDWTEMKALWRLMVAAAPSPDSARRDEDV